MSAFVYRRDASWFPQSKASGKLPVYHFDDGHGFALCSKRIPLVEETRVPPERIRHGRCGSPACAKRWAEIKEPR